MKICTKCKVETPDSEMIQGGKGSWCKVCSKEYTRRFRGTDRGTAYNTYKGILERCYNPQATRYEKYGGAGISICSEWLGDEGFNNFFKWYKNQPNSSNQSYQIDKDVICNSKGIKPHYYSPETCQFIKRSENQRNYSTLLKNNTSGYTGVNKNKDTWSFRLHREHEGNINRSGFLSALEAAKSRETLIIVHDLDFKLENVGSSMLLIERPDNFTTFYESSNYNGIYNFNNKYTSNLRLPDGKRKSIGVYLTEREAAEKRNCMIAELGLSELNPISYLFGFGPIKKES